MKMMKVHANVSQADDANKARAYSTLADKSIVFSSPPPHISPAAHFVSDDARAATRILFSLPHGGTAIDVVGRGGVYCEAAYTSSLLHTTS